jgi:hypothetical protein
VAEQWQQLCTQHLNAATRAWDWLSDKPRERSDRNHPLRGDLGRGQVGGELLERWQHEVTGAARIWFLIDDERKTVWFEMVSIGHPKATE